MLLRTKKMNAILRSVALLFPLLAASCSAGSAVQTDAGEDAIDVGDEGEISPPDGGDFPDGDGVTDAGADEAGDVADAGGDPDGDGGREIWRPGPGTGWQWQLTGSIDTSLDVVMYDIDLFETSQQIIDRLHADGRVVICYFSAGSWEDWRPDKDDFPPGVLGNTLDGWPDERWLDVRADEVRGIMQARLDLAAQKKCDGVEPDNVDGYANDPGFPLTFADQLDYNRFIAREAHARGLSVGLKNDLDQVEQLVGDFDWALDEECFQYHECNYLLPFIQAGKAVFQVEYGDQALADTVCPQANALGFDTLIKHLDLDAWRIPCR